MIQMQARAVRIPDELWQPLRIRAAAVGSDASKVIRELVEEWLEQQAAQD